MFILSWMSYLENSCIKTLKKERTLDIHNLYLLCIYPGVILNVNPVISKREQQFIALDIRKRQIKSFLKLNTIFIAFDILV